MILSLILALALQSPPASRSTAALNTAAIRGKVTSTEGAPLSYASVQLRRANQDRDHVTIATDSRGQFEFRNLAPGTFSVNVAKPGFVNNAYRDAEEDSSEIKLAAGEVRSGVDVKLTRAAVISGRITDSNGDPVVDAQVRAIVKVYREGRPQTQNRNNAQTNDRGEYRMFDLPPGRYYLQAGKWSNTWQNSVPLATQFFPGTTRFEDARSITVKAGEEAGGVNFTLSDAIVMTLKGHVINGEDNQPAANANVNFNLLNSSGIGTQGNTQTRADGSFTLQDMMEGLYRVNVNIPNRGAMPPGASPDAPRRPPNMNMMRIVEVNPSNASNLTLTVTAGATVTGKIAVDGDVTAKNLQVNLMARQADGTISGSFGGRTDDDGTFKVQRVQPGLYEVNVYYASVAPGADPPRIFISSVKHGTDDLTDRLVEIPESGDVALAITVDAHTASFSGKVFDGEAEGDTKPLGKIRVALISADAKKRLLPNYFRSATSAPNGTFKMTGITPGDYLIVAWPGEDPGQLLDPDVFRMVEKHAMPVKIERSANLKQDLRVTPALRTLADTFSQ